MSALYSPAEAAALSGVSQVLQRDWRRRGLLPARTSGRARFTINDILRMRVMKRCSPNLQMGMAATASDLCGDLEAIALGGTNLPAVVFPYEGEPEACRDMESLIDAAERAGICTILMVGAVLKGCKGRELCRSTS